MESFIGKSKIELIRAWGPPDKVDSDGQGGEVYSYFKSWKSDPGLYVPDANGRTRYVKTGPSRSGTKVRQFFLDKDGVVYLTRQDSK